MCSRKFGQIIWQLLIAFWNMCVTSKYFTRMIHAHLKPSAKPTNAVTKKWSRTACASAGTKKYFAPGPVPRHLILIVGTAQHLLWLQIRKKFLGRAVMQKCSKVPLPLVEEIKRNNPDEFWKFDLLCFWWENHIESSNMGRNC